MDKNVLYGLTGLGLGLFGHRYVPMAFEVGLVVFVVGLVLLFKK